MRKYGESVYVCVRYIKYIYIYIYIYIYREREREREREKGGGGIRQVTDE